jgi:DNA-binding transcriptional ArsR family regulator
MEFYMKNTSKLQKFLHTLSDINRLRIIECIGIEMEHSVGEIVAATGLSQPLVSHHLKILKKNAIVKTNRKGPFIYYRLSSPEIIEVLGILSELAQDADNTEPTLPMFRCPPWWRDMSKRKNRTGEMS